MFTSIPVDLVVFKPVVVELFPTKRIQFYSLHISGSLHFSRSLPSNDPCSTYGTDNFGKDPELPRPPGLFHHYMLEAETFSHELES
jgi:hypothetical protein